MEINITNEGAHGHRGTRMGHSDKDVVVSEIHTMNPIIIKHLETPTRHLRFKEKDLHSPKMSVSKRQKAEELIQIKGD